MKLLLSVRSWQIRCRGGKKRGPLDLWCVHSLVNSTTFLPSLICLLVPYLLWHRKLHTAGVKTPFAECKKCQTFRWILGNIVNYFSSFKCSHFWHCEVEKLKNTLPPSGVQYYLTSVATWGTRSSMKGRSHVLKGFTLDLRDFSDWIEEPYTPRKRELAWFPLLCDGKSQKLVWSKGILLLVRDAGSMFNWFS